MIRHEEKLKNFQLLKNEQRLHQITKPIVAITGGIAVGKSSVVRTLRELGQAVLCADDLIKQIYQQENIKLWLQQERPEVMDKGQINFNLLREKAFADTGFRATLEKKLYAELPQAFHQAAQKFPHQDYLYYEVPLLIEKKLHSLVDLVVLIHASPEVQKARLNQRDIQTQGINEKIIAAQTPYAEKKLHAHLEILNDGDEKELKQAVIDMENFIRALLTKRKK